jgi:dTDP-4-amino-4,6-dideoxygalactose transaminase
MDTIQAAVLLNRLKTFDNLVEARRHNAGLYDLSLSNLVQIPTKTPDRKDVYYTYTIQSENRDQLMLYLEKNGIETKIQHRELMPLHPAYKGKHVAEIANASEKVKRILSIPIHEKLTENDINYVVTKINEFFK